MSLFHCIRLLYVPLSTPPISHGSYCLHSSTVRTVLVLLMRLLNRLALGFRFSIPLTFRFKWIGLIKRKNNNSHFTLNEVKILIQSTTFFLASLFFVFVRSFLPLHLEFFNFLRFLHCDKQIFTIHIHIFILYRFWKSSTKRQPKCRGEKNDSILSMSMSIASGRIPSSKEVKQNSGEEKRQKKQISSFEFENDDTLHWQRVFPTKTSNDGA